ncbi:phosphatidate cytidylyltransferase [Phenylobacterium sp. SCN 70-31]|uniref:phosphatidate cytidylyltransferase n=1 Tax=Phenylobacterium sp. SCN 70-31 TaxID=1660129 RepID=UPI00086E5632|nr:phosphatidate cytidylyltransferase [Phenylobacterium sp. SCN 70-31]ODT88004.1 MAG: phosphatidate cytidylyltransferase [Phenylobacterium sp. SCN 70-31]
MTSSPPAKRFDWSNLGLRVASAVVLVPAAIAAAWFGGWPYLVLIAVGVALLAIEWGGMSAPVAPTRVAAAVAAAVLIAVFVGYRGDFIWAWGAILVTAAGAAVIARGVAERPADAAYGVLYIAPAALCLVWLRSTNQGHWWTLMLFAATWAADIGAFAVGSALKGPKLWPRFSPNKTWSGFVGGLAAATGVGALMATQSAFELNVWAAAGIGLAVGLATMAGDLWESALKRRFGVKDSGDLIPGHGGLLDRVDGLMFAVVVMAALRLANHWGWGH